MLNRTAVPDNHPTAGSLPDLVRNWIDRLSAGDVDGLVALYAPGARISLVGEELQGRREIAYRLNLLGRRLQGLDVGGPQAVPTQRTVGFETTVSGWLGKAKIRHEWVLDDGRIRHHFLQIVDRQAAAPSPAMA